MWLVLFMFFFKQKTAYEMRISDWSSDVCSSDLIAQMQQFWVPASKALAVVAREGGEYGGREAICKRAHAGLLKSKARLLIVDDDTREKIGRASCRVRVWQYV